MSEDGAAASTWCRRPLLPAGEGAHRRRLRPVRRISFRTSATAMRQLRRVLDDDDRHHRVRTGPVGSERHTGMGERGSDEIRHRSPGLGEQHHGRASCGFGEFAGEFTGGQQREQRLVGPYGTLAAQRDQMRVDQIAAEPSADLQYDRPFGGEPQVDVEAAGPQADGENGPLGGPLQLRHLRVRTSGRHGRGPGGGQRTFQVLVGDAEDPNGAVGDEPGDGVLGAVRVLLHQEVGGAGVVLGGQLEDVVQVGVRGDQGDAPAARAVGGLEDQGLPRRAEGFDGGPEGVGSRTRPPGRVQPVRLHRAALCHLVRADGRGRRADAPDPEVLGEPRGEADVPVTPAGDGRRGLVGRRPGGLVRERGGAVEGAPLLRRESGVADVGVGGHMDAQPQRGGGVQLRLPLQG